MSKTVQTEIGHGMKRLKPYLSYKDSGVEWLGEIPAKWTIKRLKFVCKVNPPKSELLNPKADTLVSFLPMENIGEDGKLNLEELRTIEQVWNGYTYFREGDVVIAKITPCFENGKGSLCEGLHNEIAFGTTELHVLRAMSNVFPKFIYYITKSEKFRNIGTTEMTGVAGQQRIPENFVCNFIVPFPEISVQIEISNFIDREIAKIDALIAKKERLIELLQEKRTGLITQMVTKGLDPNVPMKDSGVEWLGEIPAHWEVYPIRRKLFQRAGSIKIGPFGSQLKLEFMTQNGFKVYGQEHVIARDFDRGEKYIDKNKFQELIVCEVCPGDLVITMMGSSGRCAVVPEGIEQGIMDSHLLRIRLHDADIEPRFICLLVDESSYVRDQISGAGKGAIMQGLNSAIVKSIVLAVPPISEQFAILEFLDRETARIDALTEKVRDGIERLKEYRTTLISAAVTGKIDIREEVA